MEDFFIVKNIIEQGLKGGYLKDSVSENAHNEFNVFDGRCILDNGFDLGSIWDIILNPEFAKIMWGEDFSIHLKELVVLSPSDRVEYLGHFVKSHEPPIIEEEMPRNLDDAIMMTIRRSYSRLKEISIGLYEDACKDCYKNLHDIVFKQSVTELSERDFIILNAMNKSMSGELIKYLSQNGRSSFAICPDCGGANFEHPQECSIDIKTTDWLLNQNEGC